MTFRSWSVPQNLIQQPYTLSLDLKKNQKLKIA